MGKTGKTVVSVVKNRVIGEGDYAQKFVPVT